MAHVPLLPIALSCFAHFACLFYIDARASENERRRPVDSALGKPGRNLSGPKTVSKSNVVSFSGFSFLELQ